MTTQATRIASDGDLSPDSTVELIPPEKQPVPLIAADLMETFGEAGIDIDWTTGIVSLSKDTPLEMAELLGETIGNGVIKMHYVVGSYLHRMHQYGPEKQAQARERMQQKTGWVDEHLDNWRRYMQHASRPLLQKAPHATVVSTIVAAGVRGAEAQEEIVTIALSEAKPGKKIASKEQIKQIIHRVHPELQRVRIPNAPSIFRCPDICIPGYRAKGYEDESPDQCKDRLIAEAMVLVSNAAELHVRPHYGERKAVAPESAKDKQNLARLTLVWRSKHDDPATHNLCWPTALKLAEGFGFEMDEDEDFLSQVPAKHRRDFATMLDGLKAEKRAQTRNTEQKRADSRKNAQSPPLAKAPDIPTPTRSLQKPGQQPKTERRKGTGAMVTEALKQAGIKGN